jgi:hypothetical protein
MARAAVVIAAPGVVYGHLIPCCGRNCYQKANGFEDDSSGKSRDNAPGNMIEFAITRCSVPK